MRGSRLGNWRILVLAGAALMTFAARESRADVVYGRVSGGGFKAGGQFTVTGKDGKAITVKTDKDADYNVVLKPGAYTATFVSGGATFTATLRADAEPIHANLVFHPKPK